MRPFEKPFKVRSDSYRKWIRSLPCLICSRSSKEQQLAREWGGYVGLRTEACHTGEHGLGTKSDDIRCLPLCGYHHQAPLRGMDRIGPQAFEERHNIELKELCLRHIARYIFEGGTF